jgi:hypothetical protein
MAHGAVLRTCTTSAPVTLPFREDGHCTPLFIRVLARIQLRLLQLMAVMIQGPRGGKKIQSPGHWEWAFLLQ